MQDQIINLDNSENKFLELVRNAGETVKSWFQKPARKLESPCEFQRKNKFRYYKYRKLKDGNVELSVKPEKGQLITETDKSFQKAFVKLQRNFYK